MKPPDSDSRLPGIGTARRIALIYIVISITWILGSDRLLLALLSEKTMAHMTYLQNVKGILFLTATAGLIYFLIRDALVKVGQSQQALTESEDRFRRMVESSPIGMFIAVDTKFVYVNHAIMEILGATDPQELIGRPILDFIHPDYHPIVKQRIRAVRDLKLTAPLLEERMPLWLDGFYVWVEITAIPLEYQGNPGAQVMVRDIHARKLAEGELRNLNETLEQRVTTRTAELQQANEDLRIFSHSLAHDLRNPLRGISRQVETVLQSESVQADHAASDAARRIVAAATRLDRLLQDLFEYNQLARTEIQPRRISLVLVLHEIIGQLKREPEFADTEFVVREPMPWILAHRVTLSLVLQNLLHTAGRFVQPGAKPTVSFSADNGEATAKLRIDHSGVDLRSSDADMAFHALDEPAPGADPGGGTMLAIVSRGIARMGGKIGVESLPGGETRFWIELPKDPQSP